MISTKGAPPTLAFEIKADLVLNWIELNDP